MLAPDVYAGMLDEGPNGFTEGMRVKKYTSIISVSKSLPRMTFET